MSIKILDSELVNQIAAGEVVERPASVVKELVENAIDAGATEIEILLEHGGRRLIEVRDNGCGMSERDALMAVERHATSKINAFEDLLVVSTLGFRGEALPSIASVSRFALVTSDGSGSTATEVSVGPDGRAARRPAARDRGTTVRVAELFENVPARRKFLRSADAEFRAIVSVVTSYSLPSPMLAFRVEHNGRLVLDLPVAADRRERVLQILGREADGALTPLDTTIGSCRASGFVTRGLRYGSRRNQYFFVNGRLVKDRVLAHAVSRAAAAFDGEGHPAVFLFLELPPREVDVNVHPAKTEVRFRDSSQVHVVVEQGVKAALGGAAEGMRLLESRDAPEIRNGNGPTSLPPSNAAGVDSARIEEALSHTPLFRVGTVVQPPSVAPARAEAEAEVPRLGALGGRIIGQYRMSYVLVDSPEGLRLIDQHAAHERVLYDRIGGSFGVGALSVQRLLSPLVHEAGGAEAAALESHLEELRAAGFEIERFSGDSFAISAIPSALQRHDIAAFLRKLVDSSMGDRGSHAERVRERVIASLACQAAIKIHRPMTGDEMTALVADLLESSNPWACPHGRPTIVDIRQADIERHFHRR